MLKDRFFKGISVVEITGLDAHTGREPTANPSHRIY